MLNPKVVDATFCTLPLEREVARYGGSVRTPSSSASLHGCQIRSSLSNCVIALVCGEARLAVCIILSISGVLISVAS